MKSKQKSLYYILSFSIVAIVIFAMIVYFVYNYMISKSSLIENLQERTNISALQLNKVISPFLSAYSVNEYENILLSYMEYKDIFAIVVEDYNMSKVLGNNQKFITGKIRKNDGSIVALDKHEQVLQNAAYSKSAVIKDRNGVQIGLVTVYGTNKFITAELQDMVVRNAIMVCIIAVLLICFLYFMLNVYVFNPLQSIVNTIQQKDDKGLPLEKINIEINSLEFEDLSNTMNHMIEDIKSSRTHLEELNHYVQTAYHNYQNLLKNSSDAVFIMQLDGKLIEYSQMAQTLLGYDSEEMKNLTVFDWDKDITTVEYNQIISSIEYEPVTIERIHTRKDGSTYTAEIRAVKVLIDEEKYLHASVRDITERKVYEKLIKTQKEEFETIFNYSKDGIALLNLDLQFQKFNQAYLDMTGYSEDELLTKTCLDLTAKEDVEKTQFALQEVLKFGYIENFEKTCLLKDDKRVQVNISMSLLPDKEQILIVSRDTSSLKIMQEQAKLASMGEMIGNIAHQWRQPLSVITSSVSGLKLQSDFGEIKQSDIDECVTYVIKQANYLSKTIDNFRDFIKGNKEYKQISVKTCIENSINLINASLKNNYVKLVLNLESDMKINGNPNELSEALINIINNSIDALKYNIEVEKDRYVFIQTMQKNSNTLEVKIFDSAGGISEEHIERIFEPYFTTKHQYQGTGLGLYISDKIIRERHNGIIDVHNETYIHNNKEYKGACFTISFQND